MQRKKVELKLQQEEIKNARDIETLKLAVETLTKKNNELESQMMQIRQRQSEPILSEKSQ